MPVALAGGPRALAQFGSRFCDGRMRMPMVNRSFSAPKTLTSRFQSPKFSPRLEGRGSCIIAHQGGLPGRSRKLGRKRQKKRKKSRTPALEGKPQRAGLVTRLFIMSPKKPNSGDRKCAYVRLSNGQVITATIPGINHDIQEYARVLIAGKRVRDLPGVKYGIIRGVKDASPVEGRRRKRSRYGVKLPKDDPSRGTYEQSMTNAKKEGRNGMQKKPRISREALAEKQRQQAEFERKKLEARTGGGED